MVIQNSFWSDLGLLHGWCVTLCLRWRARWWYERVYDSFVPCDGRFQIIVWTPPSCRHRNSIFTEMLTTTLTLRVNTPLHRIILVLTTNFTANMLMTLLIALIFIALLWQLFLLDIAENLYSGCLSYNFNFSKLLIEMLRCNHSKILASHV